MSNYNVAIRRKNNNNQYDTLYPKTTINQVSELQTSLDTLQNNIDSKITYYDVMVSNQWTTGSAPYEQSVSIPGILSTDNPIIDVNLSDSFSTAIEELSQFYYINQYETSDNLLSMKCFVNKPTISIPLTLICLR